LTGVCISRDNYLKLFIKNIVSKQKVFSNQIF